MSVEAAGQTHPGLHRAENEDAFAVLPDAGLLIVADGLGGHPAGEVASRMAVDLVCDRLFEPQRWPPRVALAALVDAIERASLAVFRAGQRSPALSGMGTTLVASLAFQGSLVVAHVGDSRAYLLREHWLARLTEDHTVRNLPCAPVADAFARFAYHPGSLTRSLGTEDRVEVETRTLSPRPGDLLLLCSDGLTNVVGDPEIAGILGAHADLAVAAGALIARANAGGGPDNVTVALQRWS
jgi:PPM family protein phosphatase